MKKTLLLLGMAIPLLVPALAEARLTKFVVDPKRSESPTFGGYAWPGVGQYEKIVGTAYGEIDPRDRKNAGIVDVELAPRNANGNVTYSHDFYILKPIDLANGAHKVMYEPPNRGNKTWATLGRFVGGNDPGSVADPATLANAFFMPRGYTIVFSGWDKSAGTNNANFVTTISLPVAHNQDGSTITGPAFEYIVSPGARYTLNYPAATLDQGAAKLTHRLRLDDQPETVPPTGWAYTDASGTAIKITTLMDSTLPHPTLGTMTCPSGTPAGTICFVNNDIYEFSYVAKDPTVNTVGLAAIRDFNAWLRYERRDDAGNPNPLAGDIRRIYTEVVSQPARTLNDFTHLGFNQAENGKIVFDGMLQWIGAGDGISLNYRFSQPGRTERNRQDHLFNEAIFPFANVETFDPISRERDSRYARCERSHTCPVAMEIYSANEYWVKAASLLHTTPDGRRDLPDSPFARNYFISSHQHGSAAFPPSKGNCQQLQNPLNSAPIQRALFIAMDEWVTKGREPPRSRVPRLWDGTLVPPLPQSGMGFPDIPSALPTPTGLVTYSGLKTTRYRFDLGPLFYSEGIATINPPLITPPYENNPANGPIYPSFIPKTDSDGNDIAGIHMADIAVPVATYTGWALRPSPWTNDGCESSGQFIPFAKTRADRVASGDPRPSDEERYSSLDDYAAKVAAALQHLVDRRLLLCEDFPTEFNRLITQMGKTTAGLKSASGVDPVPPACVAPPSDHHGHDHDRDRDDRDDDD